MPPPYENRHGRRMTRGVRPWLLIPKLLAVAVYFGSLVVLSVIWFAAPHAAPDDEVAIAVLLGTVNMLSWLFRAVTVPAVVLTILFGVLLLSLHPRQLLRMRWLQVKLGLLVVAMPAMHLLMATRLPLMREALEAGRYDAGLAAQINWGFLVLIVGSIGIIILGRQKLRLGQNIALAHRKAAGIDKGATSEPKQEPADQKA